MRASPSSVQRNNDLGEVTIEIKGGARGKINSTKYSQEEITKLLEGYVSISSEQWQSLQHGQHIRYVRKLDNKFVRGGFVSGYSVQNGRPLITLANSFNANAKGYSVWTIGLNAIKQLYVKKGRVPTSATTSDTKKTTEIQKLKTSVAKLKKQLRMKSHSAK